MKKITARRVDVDKMPAVVLRDFVDGRIPFECALAMYPGPELLSEEEDIRTVVLYQNGETLVIEEEGEQND